MNFKELNFDWQDGQATYNNDHQEALPDSLQITHRNNLEDSNKDLADHLINLQQSCNVIIQDQYRIKDDKEPNNTHFDPDSLQLSNFNSPINPKFNILSIIEAEFGHDKNSGQALNKQNSF